MVLFAIIFVLSFIPLIVFYPMKVVGRKNLKGTRKQGVIFACNHQSLLDVPILGSKLRRYQKFVAKKELAKNPFMRCFIKTIGSYIIERGKPNLEFYKKATAHLKKGGALTIFPEGTRKKVESEDMAELKNGIAMFAIKTKCIIIPVYIKKKPRLFRLNKMFIGEPFRLDCFDKVTKENLLQATATLSQKFEQLKQKANEN